MLFGGSWGSTLGLAYAERHPQRVTEIVLGGVTTTRRAEIDWLYRGVAPLFPAQWARFRAGVPPAERDGDLVAAYYRLLQDPDPAIHMQAAKDWCAWEAALVSVDPEATPEPAAIAARLSARVCTHRDPLFSPQRLAGRRDAVATSECARTTFPASWSMDALTLAVPLVTAWELAQAWPKSELVIVHGAGHASD